ncbi:MAG: hypothetical protein EON54_19850, partial [Alcaligenaceae bacterium]
MSETSYQIGKTLGQSRWIVLTVLIVALGSCMWLGKRAEEQRVVETARLAKEKELARKQEEELAAKREAEIAVACTKSGPHFAAASAEAARGRMHEAFRALDTCRRHLSDPAVKALYVKAMDAARKKDEADGQRMIAAAKARKKKEGVQLGMGQQ